MLVSNGSDPSRKVQQGGGVIARKNTRLVILAKNSLPEGGRRPAQTLANGD